MYASALAFSGDAILAEVVSLSGGFLARREYNARKGKMGWMVYDDLHVRRGWFASLEAAKRA